MNKGPARQVLIISPNTSDAALASTFLREAAISTIAVPTLDEALPLLKQHYGCLVLVQEGIGPDALEEFRKLLREQPPWSDLPIVLIASPDSTLHVVAETLFPEAGNVTLLQRPLHPISFVSAVKVALRGRQRQFQVRKLISQREEAVKKRDEFIAMLSHELRNPLVPLRNAAYILNRLSPAGPNAIESITIIDNQVTHLSRLVDDLLDVSRLENGKLELRVEVINLNTAISSALTASASMTQAASQSVVADLSPFPIIVRADRVRLEQVLVNLITNASKFTPSGGQISVRTKQSDGLARITVEDNGMGIAPQKLGTIFDLFEQVDSSLARSAGGLGIGLTVVKRLVELHGGTIRAESEGLGKGAKFIIDFPVVESEALAPEKKPSTENRTFRRKRILVVDDNADIRSSLSMLISMWEHEVLEAATGSDAVSTALKYEPDLALIDIGLPELDGFEVARRIRRSTQEWAKRAKLVALTGYGQTSDRDRALQAGFDLHLVKPVDLDILKDLLEAGG